MIQNIHLNCYDINKDKSVWSEGMICAIWTYAEAMWKSRNELVNGKDIGEKMERGELLGMLQKELDFWASLL